MIGIKNIVYALLIISFFVIESKAFEKNENQSQSEILFIQNDQLSDPNRLYNDILNLGYSVDIILPDSCTADRLRQYDMVVLSTGKNPLACQSTNMRLALQSFIIEDNGKVIVEGGHNGYIAAVFPFYLGFRNKVMCIDDWVADFGGNLIMAGNHLQSLLANEPNILPLVMNIDYTGIYDMDVCTNNKFSELFYGTSLYDDKVGILVAPSVSNPQVINYFFDYSVISNRVEANKLLQNTIFNLIGKPVSVSYNDVIIPSSAKLYQNYPNPFNPVTNLEFSISKSGFVSLKIFDMLGNEVATLVNAKLKPGSYKYNFDASVFSSGVYFYKLRTDDYIETRKMTIIK